MPLTAKHKKWIGGACATALGLSLLLLRVFKPSGPGRFNSPFINEVLTSTGVFTLIEGMRIIDGIPDNPADEACRDFGTKESPCCEASCAPCTRPDTITV